MANNSTADPGSGGDSFTTTDLTTFTAHSATGKLPGAMLYVGAASTATAPTSVTTANPLPISGSVSVSGTVTVGAHAVTNAGTFVVQVDGTALTRLTDIETNTDSGAVVGNGAAATAQRVTLANDSTGIVALTTSTASIGKLAANSGVDIGDVDVTSIAAGDNNIGNVDIVTVPTDPFGANADAASATGSISAKLRFIASTGIPITGTVTVGSHAVTNAGTFAVQVDGAALTSLQLIDDAVSGAGFNITQLNGVNVSMGNGASGTGVQRVTIANDSTGILAGVTTVTTVTTCSTVTTLTGSSIAHDGADSGNPHKIGAKATTSLSAKTMVADNDRSDLFAGTDGVLIVRPHTNLEDVVQERTTNTDGASTAFASGLAAPGSGVRLWVTKVTVSNSSATFCTVDLRDGAAGSVLWTIPVPATGGAIERFDPPLRLSANTALAFDASAATSTLSISANGFKSKV